MRFFTEMTQCLGRIYTIPRGPAELTDAQRTAVFAAPYGRTVAEPPPPTYGTPEAVDIGQFSGAAFDVQVSPEAEADVTIILDEATTTLTHEGAVAFATYLADKLGYKLEAL